MGVKEALICALILASCAGASMETIPNASEAPGPKIIELSQRDDTRTAKIEAAQRMMLAAHKIFLDCAKESALRLASSDEPAEVVARAAAAGCGVDFGSFRTANFKFGELLRQTFAESSSIAEAERAKVIEGLTLVVIQRRAGK